jgi:WD40-like Beta Propeller Repeat
VERRRREAAGRRKAGAAEAQWVVMKKLFAVTCLSLLGSIVSTAAACARSEAGAARSTSAAARAVATTTRVSVSGEGQQGDRDSFAVGISGDGRYVVLTSQATNLVVGDTNLTPDAFIYDRQTGQTTRVSVSSTGQQGTPPPNGFGGSSAEGISADGRTVVFRSIASNLITGDSNGVEDIFVHDDQTGLTTRVSVSSTGQQGNAGSTSAAISADGRYVAFTSAASNLVSHDTNRALDIFVYDRKTGRTSRVSIGNGGRQANGWSEGQAISAHGRFVAFTSIASNLVVGDTNRLPDVFVRDRVTGKTERISVSSSGRQASGSTTNNGSNAPSMSAYGGPTSSFTRMRRTWWQVIRTAPRTSSFMIAGRVIPLASA